MANCRKSRVGVLIPTYNRVDYLKEALDSVIGQSYDNLEIIVIDNCSTDATCKYMHSVSDFRLKYVRNGCNLGMMGSVSKGIEMMSEDVLWSVILCDDDLLSSDFVEKMLHFVETFPTMHIAYGHLIYIDGAGKTIGYAQKSRSAEDAISYLKNRAQGKRETFLTGLFFLRKSFLEMGGCPNFTTSWAVDDGTIFHLGVRGGLIGANSEAKCYIRRHGGSESTSLSEGMLNHYCSLLDLRNYCVNIAKVNNINTKIVYTLVTMKITNWLTGIIQNYIHNRGDNPDLNVVIDMLSEKKYFDGLPLRIKVDVYIYRNHKVILEKFRLYHLIWRILAFHEMRSR